MKINTLPVVSRNLLIKSIIPLVAVVIILFVGKMIAGNEGAMAVLAEYGYLGAFVLGIISGVNIIIPIPVVAFAPTLLDAGLSFWPLMVVMTIGVTIADCVAFFLGRFTRELSENLAQKPWMVHLEQCCHKNWWATGLLVFLYATFVPLPNELILIPLAFFGHKFRILVLPLFIGNLIFNAIASGLLNTL